jgi:uncharacterized protein YukE
MQGASHKGPVLPVKAHMSDPDPFGEIEDASLDAETSVDDSQVAPPEPEVEQQQAETQSQTQVQTPESDESRKQIQNLQQLTATLRKQVATLQSGQGGKELAAKVALTKSRLQEAISQMNDNVMDQPKNLRKIASETDAQFTEHQQQMAALREQQEMMSGELERVAQTRISNEFDTLHPELKGQFTRIYSDAEAYADSMLDRNDPGQAEAWAKLANSTYRGLIHLEKTASAPKKPEAVVTGTKAPLPSKKPVSTQPVGRTQQAKPSAPSPKTAEDFLSMLSPLG